MRTVVALVVLLAALPCVQAGAVQAAGCPPASVGGPAVGSLTVGRVTAPITPVSVSAGGVLDPPPTNRAVGLSRQHARLDARRGTSVLTWHVRYGPGCDGVINALLTAPIGTEFEVAPKGAAATRYRVVERLTVRKGRYRLEWFRQDGPHRLALFTCADLRDGAFRDTVAVFANPVS